MKQSNIKNLYPAVQRDGTLSYGGNQAWGESMTMRRYGCGVIAGTDLLLYLSLHNEKCCTEVFEEEKAGNGILDGDSYISYVNYMRRRYLPILPFFGMPGWTLALGINQYLRKYHTGLRATWGVFHKNLWVRISAMLAHDIPVILAIGPNFPLFWRKHKLTLYHKGNDGNYTPSCQVRAHYVTVTGMDDTWLRVSSWGKEYYVNKKEYITYARRYSCFLVSNICYIRKR